MRSFLGETLGTFILILFGCSAGAVSILFGEHNSIFQVGLVWGLAVTLACFVTRHICCAHFNPAVTIAMVVAGRMPARQLPVYLGGQILGGLLAATVMFLLFNPSIEAYEALHGIVRGTPASVDTARMFGEFYPNPGDTPVATVTLPLAMGAEVLGTFLLLTFVFGMSEDCNVGRPSSDMQPFFVGLAVASLIFLVAPLTQACFNPVRDFCPRLVTYLGGWGTACLPDDCGGWFWVYIFSPILGGVLGALFFRYVLEPLSRKASQS